MEIKSEKIVKKILSFFFSKLQQIVFFKSNFFFRFGQILFNFARMFSAYMYHEKIFVPAFIKVSIDH